MTTTTITIELESHGGTELESEYREITVTVSGDVIPASRGWHDEPPTSEDIEDFTATINILGHTFPIVLNDAQMKRACDELHAEAGRPNDYDNRDCDWD